MRKKKHSAREVTTSSGLLIGHGKKVKFRGIFRDKITEKSANFAGISQEFSGQTIGKKTADLVIFGDNFR